VFRKPVSRFLRDNMNMLISMLPTNKTSVGKWNKMVENSSGTLLSLGGVINFQTLPSSFETN
jgi:hypothetical protein